MSQKLTVQRAFEKPVYVKEQRIGKLLVNIKTANNISIWFLRLRGAL